MKRVLTQSSEVSWVYIVCVYSVFRRFIALGKATSKEQRESLVCAIKIMVCSIRGSNMVILQFSFFI